MINTETIQPKQRKEVEGFIPGIQNLEPEAQARLAAALAQEPGAYNSPQSILNVIARKEQGSR